MKKILAGLAASTLLLVVAAAPAGAFWWGWSNDDLEVNNSAYVKNVVDTVAKTGGNKISAMDDVWGGTLKSGAAGAVTQVMNKVNTNSVDCGCYDDVTLNNSGVVKNYLDTIAKTGYNKIWAWDDVRGGSLTSGNADAATLVDNIVNTNVVGN